MAGPSLDKQFVFYASYHRNRWNILIHLFFVWPIVWSGIVLFQYAPLEISSEFLSPITSFQPINLAVLVATFFFAGPWIKLDKRAGTLAAVLVMLCLFTGRKFYLESEAITGYPAWLVGLFIQIVAWGSQVFGHQVFEGRAPALVDSPAEGIRMGPMFVLLEVMFAFGYRKEFQKKIWKKVDAEIARIKAEKRQKAK